MNNIETLEYLMDYNKKSLEMAEEFLGKLEEESIKEYWKGIKAQAEINIRILQTHGVSAK